MFCISFNKTIFYIIFVCCSFSLVLRQVFWNNIPFNCWVLWYCKFYDWVMLYWWSKKLNHFMYCHLLFYHNQYPNVMTELLFSIRYASSVRSFKLFVASFLIAFKYLDACFRVLIIIVLSFVSVLVGLWAVLNVWIFVSILLISITL